MAPLSKDIIEVANPAGEVAGSIAGNQSKSAAGHLRSDAVSLEVPVRVHGSKVTEVVLGTTPHTEPFEEQTSTMIIFPQGGVLRMNTAVNVGQMLVLTNLKSRQDAICRVVKVRPNAKLAAYIEVEFTQRQPGYWGLNFPSDGDAAASKVQAPVLPTSALPPFAEKSAADVSWAPAPPKSPGAELISGDVNKADAPPPPPVQRFVPEVKPEPSFISIGSQEEVQPAASATSQIETKPETFSAPPPQIPAPIDFPSAPSAAPPSSLSMSDLRGDDEPALAIIAQDAAAAPVVEVEPPASQDSSASESPRGTFGSFAGGNTLAAARASSTEDFGARLESGFGASAEQAARPNFNWTLIAAVAAILIVVLGGGFFFRSRSSNGRAANTNSSPATQQPAQPVPQAAPATSSQSPILNSTVQLPNASANTAPQSPPINGAPAPLNQNPATAITAAPVAASAPVAQAKPVTPKVTPGMMLQSLSAHPTSAQRTEPDGADPAPAFDGPVNSDGGSSALSGISSTSHVPNLAPPTVQPEQPVKIGGDVKEPRLISSILPIYPLGARQAGVEGDVVVHTTIDKNGSVIKMSIASGPPMLRQAALDALRRWKYAPSLLNGQPVAVEMEVTIKFRR